MPGGYAHPRMHFPWCAVINICVCGVLGQIAARGCRNVPQLCAAVLVRAIVHVCVFSNYAGAQIKITVGICRYSVALMTNGIFS